MRWMMLVALLAAAAPGAAQMPTADQRMQEATQRYQDSLAACDAKYQARMQAINDPQRRSIANAAGLAMDEYQRCRNWAETQFRYAGKLREQPHY